MGLIAVFDFDGTLVKEDSMVLFFRRYYKHSFGNAGISVKIVWETIKFFLKINTQKQFKEKFINLVVRSCKNTNLEEIAKDFSKFLLRKIFKDALLEINRLRKKGYETILLSASTDFYLKEIKDALGFSELICTKTSIQNGKITIDGENCYGQSKVSRLMEKYPGDSVNWQNSFCFSDNSSDKCLLSLFGNPFVINNRKFAAKNPDFVNLAWK